MARAAFGDEVVDHYLNYARTEQELFDRAVTCYERRAVLRAWLGRVIGITAYAEPGVRWGVWEVPAAVVPLAYVRQVEAAGGRALLVPPSLEGIDETLDVLDGLLFSGGSDIDPAEYGQEPHPETNGIRPERDRASSRC